MNDSLRSFIRGAVTLLAAAVLYEALARSGRYAFVASAVALDGRNERLRACLAPCGLPDVRDWAGLFRGAAGFAVFTHQEWAGWVRARDAEGSWRAWSGWIAERYGI